MTDTDRTSNHNAYVPLLNGTAFMGMAKVGERGTFDTTNGPYVRAADYEQVDKAWTAHLLMYAECIKERDHWKTVAEARGRDLLRNAQLLSGSADETTCSAADYEEVLADHRRLVRELDVTLNGDGAAQQASLCDIVGQVKDRRWKLVRAEEPSGGLCEGP